MNPANPLLAAVRASLRQPAFVAAILLLGVAAVGLNGSVQFLKLHFKKQPVDLRQSLEMVPGTLGPWVNVSAKEALNPEIEDVLGTKQYFFRDYIDSRLVSADELAKFNDKSSDERKSLAGQIQRKTPEAVVTVAVTYYTGMVDTVAHIPDRCYVADGYEPSEYQTPEWSSLQGREGDGRIRFISFEDKTPSRASVNKNVAYVFHCNGRYESDPLGVRKSLQNLRQRYGYYAKVELLMVMNDREQSAKVMNDFLTHALPEIEKSLPDWAAVTKQPD